jgi:hypothetical protein
VGLGLAKLSRAHAHSRTGDSILIFEDTDGDGKADKCTHFIDDLNCPTGFQFYKDGVLIMQAPDLWFVRDTDGDGRADQSSASSWAWTRPTRTTPPTRCASIPAAASISATASSIARRSKPPAARCATTTPRFIASSRARENSTYISYGFANPHGRVFDYWGNDLVTDATGNNTYFGPAFSGHIDYPQKHKNLKQFWERPSRPCPGTAILTSRHFPDDWQGNFLNLNVISFQGIYRVDVRHEGSGLWGDIPARSDLLHRSNFRPVGASVGPDGALYILDWQNPLIGHMQHHIRDPNRDHEHGRIYRLTYEGRPLMKPFKIDGSPIAALRC